MGREKKNAQSTLCASALEEKNVLRKTGGGNTPRKSMFILFFAVENVSVRTNFHKDGEVRDEARSPKKHQCVATNHDVHSLLGNDTQLNLEFPHFYTLSEKRQSLHVQTVALLICSRIYQVQQEFRQKPFKFKLIIKPHR